LCTGVAFAWGLGFALIAISCSAGGNRGPEQGAGDQGTLNAGGSGGVGDAGSIGGSGATGTAGRVGAPAAAGLAGSAAGGTGVASGVSGRTGGGGTASAAGHGGTAAGAGVSGAAGSGGSGGGGTTGSGRVFSQCRLHFGTTDGVAKNNPAMIQQLDFFTPGWMGQQDTFDMQYVCDYTKPGGTFANQVPAVVAYVAAFYAKRHDNLKDCNAQGAQQDLCQAGAAFIQQNLSSILATYESYAQGFAGCYGTTRPIIFMMEPDFYQYTISNQSQPWSAAQAGQIMSQLVNAMKKHLPNAVFSLDISPWVAPNDGQDNGMQWYSNFDLSLFTFINTSGGSTSASTAKIRGDNMTWAGVSQVTGKPIMADTGYGVNGSSAGPDHAWDTPANINARIDDGVLSISQYNPATDWGTTISGIRSQLNAPLACP
jgi:hypothetical protein